jgi:hypothetical protein
MRETVSQTAGLAAPGVFSAGSKAVGIGVAAAGRTAVGQSVARGAQVATASAAITLGAENLPRLTVGQVALAAAARPAAIVAAPALRAGATATFGEATSTAYRTTFFNAYPDLQGQVIVHHAVEQQVLKRYPGIVSQTEIHSLENLRGIPKDINGRVHLRDIRKEWDAFYQQFAKLGKQPTKADLLNKATEIDTMFGKRFMPPVRD